MSAYNNFINQQMQMNAAVMGLGPMFQSPQTQAHTPFHPQNSQTQAQLPSGLRGLPKSLRHSQSKSRNPIPVPNSNNSTNTSYGTTAQSMDTNTLDFSEKCPICLKEQFILTQNPELIRSNTVVDFMEKFTTCVSSLLGTKRLCNDPICHSYARINKLCTVIENLEKALAELNTHIKEQFLPFENEEEDVSSSSFNRMGEELGNDSPEMDHYNDDSYTGSFDTGESSSTTKISRQNVAGHKKSTNCAPRRTVTGIKSQPTGSPTTNIMKQGGFSETQLQSLSIGPPFICPETKCGKSFKQKHYLASHLLVHTQEKPFVCPKCGKAFRHNPGLFLHIRRHDGVRPYPCTENGCSYRGLTKYAVTQHVKQIHIKIQDVLCSHCPKTFSCTSQLRVHLRRKHPEIVNSVTYYCKHCPRSFKTIKRLKDHTINIHHTHEKKFICDECGKTFLEAHGVLRHKREVHLKQRKPMERKFKCQQSDCDKSFYKQKDLDRHQNTHVKAAQKAEKARLKELSSTPKPKKRNRKPRVTRKKEETDTTDNSESEQESDWECSTVKLEVETESSTSLLENITNGQNVINKILSNSSTSSSTNILRSKREKVRKLMAKKRTKNTSRNSKSSSERATLRTLSYEENETIISNIISGAAKEVKVQLKRLEFKQEENFEMKEELERLALEQEFY